MKNRKRKKEKIGGQKYKSGEKLTERNTKKIIKKSIFLRERKRERESSREEREGKCLKCFVEKVTHRERES